MEALPQASPVKLDGVPLTPNQPATLMPGARLELGDVRLTFHDAEGFYFRLGRMAATLAQQVAAAKAG